MDSNMEQVSRANVNEEFPCLGTNSGDAFKLPTFATKKSKIAIGPISHGVELKDTLVVDIPKFKGNGYTRSTIRVEYEWKPSRLLAASTNGKKKQAELSRQEVSNSNLFDALNSVVNDDDLGTNERNSKLAEKGVDSDMVSSSHDDSEVEVDYDETDQFMANGGANDPRFYDDEDYDIYDTYDIEGLTEQDLAFCDMMDINLRGHSIR
ncbi:hypothetical protein Tco_0116825 [Tanacetum coccineum]